MAKIHPAHDHHFADYAATEADIPLLVQAAIASVDRAGCALRRLTIEPSTTRKSAWLVAAYGVRTAAAAQ